MERKGRECERGERHFCFGRHNEACFSGVLTFLLNLVFPVLDVGVTTEDMARIFRRYEIHVCVSCLFSCLTCCCFFIGGRIHTFFNLCFSDFTLPRNHYSSNAERDSQRVFLLPLVDRVKLNLGWWSVYGKNPSQQFSPALCSSRTCPMHSLCSITRKSLGEYRFWRRGCNGIWYCTVGVSRHCPCSFRRRSRVVWRTECALTVSVSMSVCERVNSRMHFDKYPALDYVGMPGLRGKRIAVQGAGNVARFMIERLLEKGVAEVIAVDVDPAQIEKSRAKFEGAPVTIRHVDPSDQSILFEDVDIVSPCALGGSINKGTIPHIKAKVICGAANNQLLHQVRDDELCKEYGRIFVPDFIANRMGIVYCCDEMYGYVEPDERLQKHFDHDYEHGIFRTTRQCCERAEREGIGTYAAANALADVSMTKAHPVYGGRGQQIIQSLVRRMWDKQDRIVPEEF